MVILRGLYQLIKLIMFFFPTVYLVKNIKPDMLLLYFYGKVLSFLS